MEDIGSTHGKSEKFIKSLGQPEVKILYWRPKIRWEDNIKTYLKQRGNEDVDRIHLT
jgi:hypothetical protein